MNTTTAGCAEGAASPLALLLMHQLCYGGVSTSGLLEFYEAERMEVGNTPEWADQQVLQFRWVIQ